MNKSKLKRGLLGVGLIASLTGCAGIMKSSDNPSTTQPMRADQSVPSAQGTVTAEQTDNGNTKLDVAVEHLARPQALKEKGNVYVVWAQDPKDETPIKLGALTVDKDLKGQLQTVTPMRQFDVFITPEKSLAVSEPSNTKILMASVNLD